MKEDDKIPDRLREAGKQLPFSVPDNYFETFQQRLRDRIQQEKQVPGFARVIQLVRPRLSYAALIAGLLMISFFAARQILQSNRQLSLDNYELAEIVDYYLIDYDEELLYETLSELPEEEIINPLQENSDEIFDYLDAEDIDYSLLIDDN
jgi:hypothetical protein